MFCRYLKKHFLGFRNYFSGVLGPLGFHCPVVYLRYNRLGDNMKAGDQKAENAAFETRVVLREGDPPQEVQR